MTKAEKSCWRCLTRRNTTFLAGNLHDLGKENHAKLRARLKRSPRCRHGKMYVGKLTHAHANEDGSVGIWYDGRDIATLFKNGDTLLRTDILPQTVLRRFSALLVHRGGAQFFMFQRVPTCVYLTREMEREERLARIATSVAGQGQEYLWNSWRKRRWLVNATQVRFFADGREPEGLIRWKKFARRPI